VRAVVLAGGLGLRLRPLTQVIPKPLLPIGEKSVLEIQLAHLKNHGFDNIVIATNYKADLIESYFGDGSKWGVNLRFSKETHSLGTAGPLSLLRGELREPFLVINGDILTNLDDGALLDHHRRERVSMTVATKRLSYPIRYGNVRSEGDRLLGIEEKPELSVEIVAGIYALNPSVLDHLPDDTSVGMDELINKLLAINEPVGIFRITAYWLDIGQLDDFTQAQEVYEEHFK
jgi:NDP-mannose synthase